MKAVIIGAGRMGRRHIHAVAQAGLELAGICDLNKDALRVACDEEKISEDLCYTDAKQMLDEVQPECLVVSTTAPSHDGLVCLAAEKNVKFILCEKPMAVSLAKAQKMIDTCKKYGARLAINHQMRFMEQYTLTKSISESDELGGIVSISIHAGNFGLSMNGVHYFEMFRYMTGEYPSKVSAWFSSSDVPNPRGPQFLDKAGQIRLESESGKRFYLDAGDDQGHGLHVTYGCRHGFIVVDELEGTMTVTHRKAEHRDMPTTRYGMPWETYTRKISPADVVVPSAAVLQAMIEGDDWPDGTCGLMAMKSLVAAYASDKLGGKPVSLESDIDYTEEFPWA